MLPEMLRRLLGQNQNTGPYRIATQQIPMQLGSQNNSFLTMGQPINGLGLTPQAQNNDPLSLLQTNSAVPTFATEKAPQYGTEDAVKSGNPTETSADVKKDGFDWDGLSNGFAMLGKGMKGMSSNQTDMRAPALTDDSAQRMAAASQLWQSVMNKRKPKGLI